MSSIFNINLEDLITTEVYQKITREFPSVIANEYLLLKTFFDEKQIFAALYETKDVYEVVLKMNVIIALSYLRHIGEQDVVDLYEKELLGKAVSLGDWERILSKIKNQRSVPNGDMKTAIRSLCSLYQRQRIVQWRNTVLGHGAISPDMKSYAEDACQKIRLITDHFIENENYYVSIRHEEIEGKKGPEHYIVAVEGVKIDLAPYIEQRNGTYLFDNYLSYKRQTGLLDYARGDKIWENIEEMNERYNSLFLNDYNRHFLLQGSLNAEAEAIPGHVNAWLNELYQTESYVEMPEWDEWLSRMLSENDRGVFLLQADRAMGKTAFVSHLDPLMDGDELFRDRIVPRAYYCGRRRFRQNDDFLDQMNSGMFLKISVGEQIEGRRYLIRMDDIRHVDDNNETDKQIAENGYASRQLCDYLTYYLRFYRDYYHLEEDGGLLLIIDGIDEISFMQTMGETGILDYIPDANDLPAHTYILITSRIEGKQRETYASRFIDHYEFTGRTILRRRDPDGNITEVHRKNLQRFVLDRLKWSTDSEKTDRIIDLSDGNYINLKMLIKMLQTMGDEECERFLEDGFQPEHHLDRFLSNIYSNGGRKYSAFVDRLLSVLCSAMEPVGIRTIAFLMDFGSSMISCDLLGAVSDIDALIQVDREKDGSVLRLSNLKYREVLQRRYVLQIHNLVENAVAFIFSVCDTGLRLREEKKRLQDEPAESEVVKDRLEVIRESLLQMYQKKEIIYIHAYILNYLKILRAMGDEQVQELEHKMFTLEFLKCLADFERRTDGKRNGSWGTEKDRIISSEIIEICNDIKYDDDIREAERFRLLAVAYNCRSYSLFDLGNAKESLKDMDLAIDYGMKAKELGNDLTDFGLLYNNKAIYLRNIGCSFDEYRIWMDKSMEYKQQRAKEDFRGRIEIYLVSIANYVNVLYSEQRYNEMEEYYDLVFRENGILTKIKRQFPDHPYMIDEDGTRYEYGYFYLVTYIREIYLRSLKERGRITAEAAAKSLLEIERDFRRLIDRNRQMVDINTLIQEPLIRALYKCLYHRGKYLMEAGQIEDARNCWMEVVELLRDLDRTTRLNAVNKGLKKILSFFVENRFFDIETQNYVDELYDRLYPERDGTR